MANFNATGRIRTWLVGLFAKSVNGIKSDVERQDVLRWLADARDVVGSERSAREKYAELYKMFDTKKAVRAAFDGVVSAVQNYKRSDLPLAVKVSIPVTLLAAPFIGGQGVGIAALGGAIGLPALLLIFLGSAGISSIIEACVQSREARGLLGGLSVFIAQDEILRRATSAMKKAMQHDPIEACKANMPPHCDAIRERLLTMDPFDFERHVMGFFAEAGMLAWVTRKSNDMGVDGFAKHPEGLMVVQCKRYAPDNHVGAPAVQQFKGVIEENEAHRGYIVTTSDFSSAARQSASLSERVVLVAMDDLVGWHETAPSFSAA